MVDVDLEGLDVARAPDADTSGWIENVLLLMDNEAIREKFNQFADFRQDGDSHSSHQSGKKMTNVAFGAALDDMGIVKDEAEVEEVMKRFDVDGDGTIDETEFHLAVKSKSKMEMMLDDLPLIRGMYCALRQRFPKDSGKKRSATPIEAFVAMSKEDMHSALWDAVSCWLEILWTHQQKLQTQRKQAIAKDGKLGHDKFMFEIRGGSLDDFNTGIATRVGACSADPVKGMMNEHTRSDDSDLPFTANNYKITTTPRIEYNLAKTGGRYYEDLAYKIQRLGRSDLFERLSDLEKELVMKGGHPPSGNGPKRMLRPLSDYRLYPVTIQADLSEDEILSVVLYTGPVYVLWNAALRQFPRNIYNRLENAGNKFASSIYILSSAIKKIQQAGHALQQNMVLYRGLSGGKLPDEIFCAHKTSGKVGMTEFGVQSTTSDLNVAVNYSGVHSGYVATVLAVKISQVDSGAFLGDFSQYPAEKEYLWASMSYLQAEGEGRVITTQEGHLVRVVPVRINTNGRTMTLLELQNQRKDHVRQIYENIVRESTRELEDLKSHSRVVARALTDPSAHKENCIDPYHNTTTEPSLHNTMMVKSIVENKLPDWFHTNVESRDAKWFNEDDSHYKSVIAKTVDLKRLTAGMVWYWVEDESINAFDIAFLSLEVAEQRRIANLLSKLKMLRASAKMLREAETKRPPNRGITERIKLDGSKETIYDDDRPIYDDDDVDEDENDILKIESSILMTARTLCQLQGIVEGVFVENDKDLTAVLMRFASQGNTDAVRLLLEAGVDVNSRNYAFNGMTAMMASARTGQSSTMTAMVSEFGADVNAADSKMESPLMYACASGHTEAVQTLKNLGANLYARDAFGKIAFMKAAENGHKGVVALLASDPQSNMVPARDKNGMTALMHAAKNGHDDVVAYLVQECDDHETLKDHKGRTAFSHASANGHMDTVFLLVNKLGIDLEEDEEGTALGLLLAAFNGHLDMVRLLVSEFQLDVESSNDEGKTAVMYATENSHKHVLRSLVFELGADVNSTDRFGKTALMYSAENGDKETVLFLALELQADATMEDNEGNTARDLARARDQSEVVSLLGWLSGEEVQD